MMRNLLNNKLIFSGLALLFGFSLYFVAYGQLIPTEVGKAYLLGIFFLCIYLMFRDIEKGMLLFIALLIMNDDNSFNLAARETLISMNYIRFLSLHLLDWLGLIAGIAAVYHAWRDKERFKASLGPTEKCILGIAVIFIWTAVTGLHNITDPETLRIYVQSTQGYIFFFLMALAAYLFFRTSERLKNFFWVAFLITGMKYVMYLIRYVSGMGVKYWDTYWVFHDSARFIFGFALFPALLLIADRRQQASRPEKILYWLIAFAGLFMVISKAERGLWVLAAAGCLVLLALVERKIKLPLAAAILILAIGSTAALVSTNPVLKDFFKMRLISMFNWSDKGYVYQYSNGSYGVSESNAIKTIEIKNIVAKMKENGTLLRGEGFAASWNSKYYPLPKSTSTSALKQSELDSGKYYTIHISQLRKAFESGFVFGTIYYLLFLRMGIEAVRVLRKAKPSDKILVLTLLAMATDLILYDFSLTTSAFLGLLVGQVPNMTKLLNGKQETYDVT